MRMARIRHASQDFDLHAQVFSDRVVTFADMSTPLTRLETGDRSRAYGQTFAIEDVTFRAPFEPRAIYALGQNYAAHAKELGNAVPAAPHVFMKPATSATDPGGPVRRPALTSKLDHEVELAITVGLLRDGTMGAAGYAIADDVSARDVQEAESHLTRAKGAPTFCPFGPWVTTAEEVSDPGSLGIRSWVNGELRQDASTADLIFGVDEIVAYLGELVTLQPGDLILTGTPAGVGHAKQTYLEPGDVVRMEIDGLGSIEHPIVEG